MKEMIQLPELLTFISYAFLCVITVWVIAHGLTIFRGNNSELTIEVTAACKKLDNLSYGLGDKVTQVTCQLESWALEVAGEIRACKDIDSATSHLYSSMSSFKGEKRAKAFAEKILAAGGRKEAARVLLKGVSGRLEGVPRGDVQDLLVAIGQCRSDGPGEDLATWFEKEGIDPLLITGILEQAAAGKVAGKAGIDQASPAFLSREASEYNWRLGTAASIAPLAGMAPTMSGTMEFLGDYSNTIQSGSNDLPLSGLNTALVTTWWGCCLAIVSTILLSYVLKRRIPRARAMLREIEVPVNLAVSGWKASLRRASRIGQRRGRHV